MTPIIPIIVTLRAPGGGVRAFRRAEMAATPAAWSQGLSGRAPLAADQAMLFVFPRDVAVPFTTVEMRMPMDLAFADVHGRLLGVHRALPAGSRWPWTSPTPFRFALETAAGGLAGFDVGSTLNWEPGAVMLGR